MNYVRKRFLAWCEEMRGRQTDSTSIMVFPLYEIQHDGKFSSVSGKLPFEKCRIRLLNKYNDSILGSDFLYEAGSRIFEVCFTVEIEPRYGNIYLSTYNKGLGNDSWTILTPLSSKFAQVVDVRESPERILENRGSALIDQFDPEGRVLFLHYADQYCGPFEYEFDSESNLIHLKGLHRLGYKVGVYPERIFAGQILSLGNVDSNTKQKFVSYELTTRFKNAKSLQDWIPPDVLINEFIERTIDGAQSRSRVEQLRNALRGLSQNQGADFFSPERVEVLDALLSQYEDHSDDIARFVDAILGDKERLENILEVYNAQNPGRLEAVAKDQVNYNEIVAQLNANIANLQKDVDTLEKNKRKAREAVEKEHEGALRKINAEIGDKQRNLAAIRKDIETAGRIKNLKVEAERLASENQKAKEALESCQAKAREVEASLEEKTRGLQALKTDIGKMIETFRSEAIPSISDRLKNLIDEDLWHQLQESRSVSEAPAVLPSFNPARLMENESVPDFIEQVKAYLQNAGRHVESDDVVNYLTCLTQGFITTFAGEPGAGKTSLCNLLAKALGLSGSTPEDQRFTEISVERGWSSHKDFIGYFNPLTKRIEKSNPEVFDAFSLLSREAEEETSKAPYFFLLDEANLSPLEHYWAAFLRICDFDSVQSRVLNLGGERPLRVPDTVRFLATVNFDHTTEQLSPRFLNRSWVIMLNPSEIDTRNLLVSCVKNAEKTVPYNLLKSAFLPRPDDKPISNEMLQTWKSIQQCFTDAQCSLIMPRSQKMVQSYCITASKFMSSEDRLAPLDYAVSQKILPLISGGGKRIATLMDSLKKRCNGLPRTKALLDMMEQRSENGFYQFFAH